MGYGYIALMDATTPANQKATFVEQESVLSAMGLRQCFAAGAARVFVSPETPTLAVSGGVVIGHLFFRDGTSAKPGSLPELPASEQLSKYLLTHCWGNYLLILAVDKSASELQVMREPSGGVPCIYAFQGGTGFITSDISLATDLKLYRREVDWEFIAQALAYPYVKTARTGLAGIRELLPGCSMLVKGIDATVREDWSPWSFVDASHRHHDPYEAATEIRSTVASVVRAWAETDESILLELSGGLDSSIVAACLQGTGAHVTCYNLVTPVPGADERQYANLMANYLGVELHSEELRFEDAPVSFVLPSNAVSPRVAALQYAVDFVMDRAASVHGVSSFFSGGGGDTVFSYLRSAAPAADAFKEGGIVEGATAIQNLSTLHQCTFWKAGRLTLRKLLRGSKAPFKEDSTFLNSSMTIPPPPYHPWTVAPTKFLPGDHERIVELAGTQIFRDITLRGIRRWLRLPLLSQPVMEACLKTPTWMWIAGGNNRAIARSAFADVLPRDVLNRRSKGSFTNYSGAVYQRSKTQMREFLLKGQLRERQLLDAKALNSFFGSELSVRDTSFMRIFSLCMIENWVRNQPSSST